MENSKIIGYSDAPLVIRTDFSDDKKWNAIKTEVRKPVGPDEFMASIEFLQIKALQGAQVKDLLDNIDNEYEHGFIFVADEVTFTNKTATLLVVDLREQLGRSFRTELNQVQSIENNLSIANMDFFEFADNVEQDGVFRGFGK